MTKIVALIKSHYLAIICFFVVGAFSIAPQFLAIKSLGSEYRGIPFFYANDNIYYTAKIQEILDGHGWVSSPYFFEYKNLPSLVLPIGEYFYAIPAFLLKLSAAETAVLLNGFLLPAVLFFLAYLLIYKLTNTVYITGKINAVAGGLLVILSLDLPAVKSMWELVTDQYKYAFYLSWARPVNPITGAILLFIFFLLLWAIVNRGGRRLPYFAGLIFALTVGYFFSWGTAAATWFCLSLIFLIKKNWLTARALLGAGLIGFLLLTPYFWRVFIILQDMALNDSKKPSVAYGMFFTHQAVFNKVLAVSLLIFLPLFIYEYLKKKKIEEKLGNEWYFCLALILGGILALNQQIVTGKTIWYPHFVQYTTAAAIVAVAVSVYSFFKNRLPKLILLGDIFIMLLFFTLGFFILKTYVYGVEGMRNLQQYRGVIDWLRANGEKDCVVLTNSTEDKDTLSEIIPAFTQCYTYNSNLFGLSSTPLQRARHGFLVWMRLQIIRADNVERFLRENSPKLMTYYSERWEDTLIGPRNDFEFEERIKLAATEYRAFLKKDFLTELKKYRVDYIISEKQLDIKLVKELSNISEMKNIEDFYLYKL